MGLASGCATNAATGARVTSYPVATAGYPVALPFGSCAAGNCTITDDDCHSRTAYHTCPSLDGQSGSPLYVSVDSRVRGILVGTVDAFPAPLKVAHLVRRSPAPVSLLRCFSPFCRRRGSARAAMTAWCSPFGGRAGGRGELLGSAQLGNGGSGTGGQFERRRLRGGLGQSALSGRRWRRGWQRGRRRRRGVGRRRQRDVLIGGQQRHQQRWRGGHGERCGSRRGEGRQGDVGTGRGGGGRQCHGGGPARAGGRQGRRWPWKWQGKVAEEAAEARAGGAAGSGRGGRGAVAVAAAAGAAGGEGGGEGQEAGASPS